MALVQKLQAHVTHKNTTCSVDRERNKKVSSAISTRSQTGTSSNDRHVQLTRCFSAVAELLVRLGVQVFSEHSGYRPMYEFNKILISATHLADTLNQSVNQSSVSYFLTWPPSNKQLSLPVFYNDHKVKAICIWRNANEHGTPTLLHTCGLDSRIDE